VANSVVAIAVPAAVVGACAQRAVKASVSIITNTGVVDTLSVLSASIRAARCGAVSSNVAWRADALSIVAISMSRAVSRAGKQTAR